MDFDQYCAAHNIAPEDQPVAFAAWLHEISGGQWDGDHREVKTRAAPPCTPDTTSTDDPPCRQPPAG